jgi:transcriptional regulator with XRE-family HTH domain
MAKYITHIQLRAARHALNLGVRDIAKILKVSKATISKTELGKTRDFLYKHSAALLGFFEHHNIFFPNEYVIRYHNNLEKIDKIQKSNIRLTRFQLRTARYILNINQTELANIINIDKGIITRAEQLQNTNFINPQDHSIVLKLISIFYERNIEFPDQMSVFYKKYIDNKSDKR